MSKISRALGIAKTRKEKEADEIKRQAAAKKKAAYEKRKAYDAVIRNQEKREK